MKRFISLTTYSALACLCLIGCVLMVAPVDAGPVTNGSGSAPFTKLGTYRGTLAIEIGGKALEFGNRGTDIAGTDVIQIRPNATSNPAIFSMNGSRAVLTIPGQVCLYPNGPGNAPDCRNTWPVAPPTADWIRVTDADGYSTIQPDSSTAHVSIGTNALPTSSVGTALTLNQSNANVESLQVANLTTFGPSMTVSGKTLLAGTSNLTPLVVTGGIYIDQGADFLPVFAGVHPTNEPSERPITVYGGAGSGLDAQTIDGRRATIESGSHCATALIGAQACLCIDYGTGFGVQCLPLRNWI